MYHQPPEPQTGNYTKGFESKKRRGRRGTNAPKVDATLGVIEEEKEVPSPRSRLVYYKSVVLGTLFCSDKACPFKCITKRKLLGFSAGANGSW